MSNFLFQLESYSKPLHSWTNFVVESHWYMFWVTILALAAWRCPCDVKLEEIIIVACSIEWLDKIFLYFSKLLMIAFVKKNLSIRTVCNMLVKSTNPSTPCWSWPLKKSSPKLLFRKAYFMGFHVAYRYSGAPETSGRSAIHFLTERMILRYTQLLNILLVIADKFSFKT